MTLYLIIIGLASAFITLASYLSQVPAAAWGILPTALLVLAEVVAVILLDGLGAFLIRRLPEGYFRAGRRCFSVTRGECRLWRALGVRLWCNKIPELGGFTGFHKDRVREPRSSAYLERFLLESNYGVTIHLVNALSGFLLLAIFPAVTRPIALPVAIINLILSLMPFGALRYNTPKLLALYRRVQAREQAK